MFNRNPLFMPSSCQNYSDIILFSMMQINNSTRLVCKDCDKEFFNEKDFKDHLANDVNKIKCQSCDKMFKTSINAKNHYKNVHLRAFRIACTKCERVFTNKYLLKKHSEKKHPPKVNIS